MYLVAHQDECQMVIGNVIHNAVVWCDDDTVNTNATIHHPRQCTCKPKLIPYIPPVPSRCGLTDADCTWHYIGDSDVRCCHACATAQYQQLNGAWYPLMSDI